MTSRTDREWKKWGASDPYYGVLGYSTQSVDDPQVHGRFMATGVDDLNRAMTDVEALFGPIPRGRSLDFGCGVGRLMAAMLNEFDEVAGIDISEDMITEARKNVGHADRTRYFNSIDQIPADERGFDFVHSFIVIQHIRPTQGIPLIRSLIQLVKPGGMFALHFTIADYRTRTRLINFFRYRMKALHVLSNVLRGRRLDEPVMEMNRYPVWKVLKETEDLTGGLYGVRFIDQSGPVGIVLMGKVPEAPSPSR